jgi:hypothetical protein
MASVKQVSNGLFYVDLDDDEDIQVSDQLLHETQSALGDERISQEEIDSLVKTAEMPAATEAERLPSGSRPRLVKSPQESQRQISGKIRRHR